MKEVIESEFKALVFKGKSIEELMKIYGLNHYNIRCLLQTFKLRIKRPKFKIIKEKDPSIEDLSRITVEEFLEQDFPLELGKGVLEQIEENTDFDTMSQERELALKDLTKDLFTKYDLSGSNWDDESTKEPEEEPEPYGESEEFEGLSDEDQEDYDKLNSDIADKIKKEEADYSRAVDESYYNNDDDPQKDLETLFKKEEDFPYIDSPSEDNSQDEPIDNNWEF